MFRCSKCGKVSGPKETQHKIVSETRDRTYTDPPSKRTKRRGPMSHKEIVSEEVVCGKCKPKEE